MTTNSPINPKLIEALTPPDAPPASSTAVLLDDDVLRGVQALRQAMAGKRSQRGIVNDILRAVIFGNDFNYLFNLEVGA